MACGVSLKFGFCKVFFETDLCRVLFRRLTKLPVILKGIITHEDARLALRSGCKGIIVSNHGARQLDTVPGTIEALPEIVDAVGSQMVVMIDGGIRNGITNC